MPQSAFIVRPFGRKPFIAPAALAGRMNDILQSQRDRDDGSARAIVYPSPGADTPGEWLIDFDAIEAVLIKPALREARIRGDTTGAVVEAGNIREDMFNRLITADLVVADVSLHNPNVFYELGLRQAFRDKFTFVIRCDLEAYPFDLQTDRYFDYTLTELIQDPAPVASRLAVALRKTLNQYRPDSPVFKLMPQLEAEDRSRFLAVPEDFREEVERAGRQRQRETLDLLALECEEHLWEVEGLRVVGRAQFEANFIDGAKHTWQRIAARYPDDAEANTVLSTVYQRMQDRTRSEQALARVSRSRTLSPSQLSELRALNGRNLKAAWTDQWAKAPKADRRRVALQSPLLQRAIDAYVDAFRLDLNNSYAGLNALSLQVIQAELIDGLPDEWRKLQRCPGDDSREFAQRAERIDQLAQALLLALESDRDRLRSRGQGDPWFAMLEAAVMCTVSTQPEYVAQLYVEAAYYAPPKSDTNMVGALQVYLDLGIRGEFKTLTRPRHLGTLGANIDAAMAALKVTDSADSAAAPKRLIVFVGLRVDEGRRPFHSANVPRHAADEVASGDGYRVFPSAVESQVRRLIEAEIDKELRREPNVLAMAGGASGGDLIFHEVCAARKVPLQMMFLPLPKAQHIGEYVASAGGDWVSRFNEIHRRLTPPPTPGARRQPLSGVKVFSDSLDLPRWLQDREHYNVGRRCMLWMLQHASNLARALDSGTEITLIALRAPALESAGSFGGIRHAIQLAQMYGVNVRQIDVPTASGSGASTTEADAAPDAETGAAEEAEAARPSRGHDLKANGTASSALRRKPAPRPTLPPADRP